MTSPTTTELRHVRYDAATRRFAAELRITTPTKDTHPKRHLLQVSAAGHPRWGHARIARALAAAGARRLGAGNAA